MPLRDHFRPPVSKRSAWEGFHAMWVGTILRYVSEQLPDSYTPEPRVELGTNRQLGESETTDPIASAEPIREYAYEVLIFDQERGRRLVAAVKIVSPANKDRMVSRQLFAAKCANLLKQDVCVSIVDLVTIRRFNLYTGLLGLMSCGDPQFEPEPPPCYAATCRKVATDGKTRLETWAFPLQIGQPLPTLPIWLAENVAVSLDLETSYEEACKVLKIR